MQHASIIKKDRRKSEKNDQFWLEKNSYLSVMFSSAFVCFCYLDERLIGLVMSLIKKKEVHFFLFVVVVCWNLESLIKQNIQVPTFPWQKKYI